MKLISTTALSKSLGISSKELFDKMAIQGLIEKVEGSWALTDKGKELGGETRESKQYGVYIVWPETIKIKNSNDTVNEKGVSKYITSTVVGKSFDLSAIKINHVFSELGWLKKGLKGWLVTEQGKKQGGMQAEDQTSGIPFARWPETIIQSKTLNETVSNFKGESKEDKPVAEQANSEDSIGFREKFAAKHRTTDGHFVRSKAEMLIDNWLYMAEIVHAYERKLPIEEDAYSDFYIPTGKVYIEYWGYENDQKYVARKKQKIELYKKYGFNLIELEDKEVQNLDDILPRMLLKYGVQAY